MRKFCEVLNVYVNIHLKKQIFFYSLRVLCNVFLSYPLSTPSPSSSQIRPHLPTSLQLCTWLCCLCTPECGAIHKRVTNLPGATPLKKIDPSSPRSHCWSMVPLLEVVAYKLLPNPCYNTERLEPVRSCVGGSRCYS